MNQLISLNFRKARKLSLLGVISLAFLGTLLMSTQTAATPSPVPPQSDAASTASPAPQKPDSVTAKTDGAAASKTMSPAEERQAKLAEDTNKLYQLAQELQAEVAKSTKNTLSLAVVKKAAEVERLAKSLKERMKSE